MATKCDTWSAELVALKASTSALRSSYDSASANAINFINAFDNGFGQYNCGEALRTAVLQLRSFISTANSNHPAFLTVNANVVQFSNGSCKGGSFNCSKDGCIAAINSVNSSSQTYFNALKALQTNLLNIQSKESQIANDPECKLAQEEKGKQDAIDQGKNRQITNGIIWFIVVSAVVGVLAYLDKKYWHIVLK